MRDAIKKLFSESGEVSYSRLASFLALLAVIGWVSFLVWKKVAMPDMTGPIGFPATMYALGKSAESAQKIFGGGNKQP